MGTDVIEVWEDDVEDLQNDISMFNEDSTLQHSVPLLVLWLVYFLAMLQKKHYLPDATLLLLLVYVDFFQVLGRMSPQLSDFHQHFPCTLYQLHKILGTSKETFVRYISCQKCSSVYKYNEKVGTRTSPKLCSNRVSRYTRACNGALLKIVELKGGIIIHYPLQVFCYMLLHKSLQILLNRPGFHDLCEHWKRENRENGIYNDLYNGKVWA